MLSRSVSNKHAGVSRLFHVHQMKKLFFLLALLAAPAFADEYSIGVHVGSRHDRPGFNDSNPGLYARSGGGIVGFYRNSERGMSLYAGRVFDGPAFGPVSTSLVFGGVTGYKAGALLPLVYPSAALRVGSGAVRIGVVPAHVKAVHLSFEVYY